MINLTNDFLRKSKNIDLYLITQNISYKLLWFFDEFWIVLNTKPKKITLKKISLVRQKWKNARSRTLLQSMKELDLQLPSIEMIKDGASATLPDSWSSLNDFGKLDKFMLEVVATRNNERKSRRVLSSVVPIVNNHSEILSLHPGRIIHLELQSTTFGISCRPMSKLVFVNLPWNYQQIKTLQAIIKQVLDVMQIPKVIENVLGIREFSANPGRKSDSSVVTFKRNCMRNFISNKNHSFGSLTHPIIIRLGADSDILYLNEYLPRPSVWFIEIGEEA